MNMGASKKESGSGSTDPYQCNGCGVCMLSCPVWQQHHTKALTYCGRSRAAIGGAGAEDLVASAKACILCGSCEPLCPMGIPTQQVTMALRRNLADQGLFPKAAADSSQETAPKKTGSRLLVAGRALLTRPGIAELSASLLGQGTALFPDDGYDIALAMEAGQEIREKRLEGFTETLKHCSHCIVSDGMLFNMLRVVLPSSVVVQPLGQALLASPAVRSALRRTDFFVIEPRAYNATRRESVKLYDALREQTGCFMNLDLQRVATPTGASSYQHQTGLSSLVSVEAQVNWMLEGRSPDRIVAEHPDDANAFRKNTSLPVLHLAEVVL